MRPDDLRRDPAFQTAVGQLCSNHNAASCRAKAPGSVLSIFAVAGFMCDLCLGPDNLSLHCTALHCTALHCLRQNRSEFPRRPKKYSVIPAKAGIHTIRHSREGGNPQFPRTREFIVLLPQCLKKYSVILAKAGIHTIRHSREGGNPQFPRTREFIVP